MRWDGDDDDGADDGDGGDDDPDDARRDGDDDGGDSTLREGNSPKDFSLPKLFFSLSGFRLVEAAEKLLVDTRKLLDCCWQSWRSWVVPQAKAWM